jgi:ANTAR domain
MFANLAAIEHAKDAVMVPHGLTDAAFDLLRSHSRIRNVKLRASPPG